MIEIAVIIVNWNGKKYLKDCLDSLRAQTYKDFRIIFIDNGSEDGSADFVRENYPETEIKEINRNVGFAAGYNLGIRQALKDKGIKWALALNNDTRLHEKFIENMVNCGKEHSAEVGSIQPKVLNFFERNKIDCVGIILAPDGTAHNRGYGQIDQSQYETDEEIFGSNATAALYARESLEKTKLPDGSYFDRDHFAYYEDVDLAWRMRLAGFSSFYCPKAEVYHVHSGTAGQASLLKAYYLHRNYFFTIFKNYPAGIMMKALGRRFLSYVRLVLNISKKEKREAEFTINYGKGKVALTIIKAWASVIANFPSILKKRHFIQKNKKVSKEEIKEWLEKYGLKS